MANTNTQKKNEVRGDGLRTFQNWTDLAENAGEDDIVRWVNELHSIHADYSRLVKADEQRKQYHKRRQIATRETMRLAKQLLDKDELQRINQIAIEKLEEEK